MDAKTLIIHLGDYNRVAEKLGCAASTVGAWKTRNRIPRSSWPDLLALYPRRVTLEKLRLTERTQSAAQLDGAA